jgi:hypothetical protein
MRALLPMLTLGPALLACSAAPLPPELGDAVGVPGSAGAGGTGGGQVDSPSRQANGTGGGTGEPKMSDDACVDLAACCGGAAAEDGTDCLTLVSNHNLAACSAAMCGMSGTGCDPRVIHACPTSDPTCGDWWTYATGSY